ncbi:MAG: YbhB/YbcL family Raf kinase inhibitor-like protein [Bacilli bacterium]|jgi:Raf kinase inhibitor-like YbhB/YbcL family protein
MQLISPAFNNGEFIPIKYTGLGEDLSIPLIFKDLNPLGKSIALIMDDPDAPREEPFVHWVIFNIPSSILKIPEGIPTNNKVLSLEGAIQGKNDAGKIGYIGPNPPSGVHTYKIKAYLLDSFLDLKEGVLKKDLEKEMQDHIISKALLEGKFQAKEKI